MLAFDACVESGVPADAVRQSRVMPGDGVREDLGNAPIVRLFGERRDFSAPAVE